MGGTFAIAAAPNRLGRRLELAALSEQMLRACVSIRAPASFRADIAWLEWTAKRNLHRLRQLAELRVQPSVEIPRDCHPALRDAIETHRVIVGAPGGR